MKQSLTNIAGAYKTIFASQESYLLDISKSLFTAIEDKQSREFIRNLFDELLSHLKTYFDTSDVLLSLSLHQRSKKLLYSNKELLKMFTNFKEQVNTEQLDVLCNQIELVLKELELHITEMNAVIKLFNEHSENKISSLKQENKFGIEIIDFQHEQLFKLSDKIIELADKPEEIDEICNLFQDLIHGHKLHFAFEEFFFLQFNYPEYQKHKEEHERLITVLNSDLKKIQNGTMDMPLKEYFIAVHNITENHIENYDQGYNVYIKNSGLLNE